MEEKKYLYCFPYAGGNSSVFDNLKKELEPEISLVKIEYPGHGKRFREKLAETWEELLKDVEEQLSIVPEKGIIFLMGYSMGSLVAMEIVQRNLLRRKPEHVFIISHNAPHETSIENVWVNGSDYEIVSRMKCLGGFERVNEAIISSNYFQTMFLRPLKADYHLLKIYQNDERTCHETDATVIYSKADMSVNHVSEWKQYFRNVDFKQLGSNHFILKEHVKEIAEIIRKASLPLVLKQ